MAGAAATGRGMPVFVRGEVRSHEESFDLGWHGRDRRAQYTLSLSLLHFQGEADEVTGTLFRGAHVNREHGLQAWSIPLAAFGAAVCFAILGGLKARQEAETSAGRMLAWGGLVASLFVGAGAFVLGFAVALLTQLEGNSGSSAPGAWQSKPALVQPSVAPNAANEQR